MKRISALKVPKDVLKNGISPSQCEAFMQCRRKWLLRVNGYTTPTTEARTSFGSLFHYYLSRFYQNQAKRTDELDKWGTEWLITNNIQSGEQQAEFDIAVAAVVFAEYVKRYAFDFEHDFIGTELDMKTKAKIPQRCVIDSMFEDKQKRLWVMEHKTKGRIDEDGITQQLSMDFQCLFQISVVQEVLKRPVTGMIYNIIRTPQLRRGENETIDAYCARVQADMEKRPEFYFMRFEVVYTPAQVNAFLHEYVQLREEMQAAASGKTICYRNPYNCLGRYKCDFIEHCASDSLAGLIKA